MKKRAILYIRVSTDEQTKGYSPADQEERLIKYCHIYGIEAVAIYREDESAKDFANRPEWQHILAYLKKNRHAVDLILCVKWDRFSRNATEAYATIAQLRRYNVEVQAIEQPLDTSIPENKFMLGHYLIAPEVENDRRALNTLRGMRKAKRSGRWVSNALKGYKMRRDENNKPIMVPSGDLTEQLIRKAFIEFATGLYSIEDLRRKLNREGLRAPRNTFWAILRNRAYTGKIYLSAFEDEPAEWRNGIHEPLVSEDVFEAVQDVLTGRKKARPTKYLTMRNELPLRGFMTCPQCGRTLTGSGSRGKGGKQFFYYHCNYGCKERQKADEANAFFMKGLKKLRFDNPAIYLYGEMLKKQLKSSSKQSKAEIDQLQQAIAKQAQRLKNIRGLMYDGEIPLSEYKSMEAEINEETASLNKELYRLREDLENFDEQIDFCVTLLQNIDGYFDVADTETKQQIVCSIFPHKLVYNENKYRTPEIEPAVSLLCLNNGEYKGSKTKKHPFFEVFSCMVARTGFETLGKDLLFIMLSRTLRFFGCRLGAAL